MEASRCRVKATRFNNKYFPLITVIGLNKRDLSGIPGPLVRGPRIYFDKCLRSAAVAHRSDADIDSIVSNIGEVDGTHSLFYVICHEHPNACIKKTMPYGVIILPE